MRIGRWKFSPAIGTWVTNAQNLMIRGAKTRKRLIILAVLAFIAVADDEMQSLMQTMQVRVTRASCCRFVGFPHVTKTVTSSGPTYNWLLERALI